MGTPSIKEEQARNARDAMAEAIRSAAEEEVEEKNIEQEHLEIESIKESDEDSVHNSKAKDNSVIESVRQQDQPSEEESKVTSPERSLTFGKLQAAELENNNADSTIHQETNSCTIKVANGNQL